MSQFFSSKFLRYRDAVHRGRLDEDLHCPACGYNLRGLERGRNCPECGQSAWLAQTSTGDPLLAGDASTRRSWELGLGLAAGCALVAAALRLAFFVRGMTGVSTSLALTYIALIGINAAVWTLAVWLSTPACIELELSWLRRPRRAARLLSLFWVPACACLATRYWRAGGGLIDDWLVFGDLVGRTLGGIGALCFAFVMLPIAQRAELMVAAGRLNAVVWLLWFPTVLAQAFSVAVVWFLLIPLGFVLLGWSWLLTLLALALWSMHQHLRWARRHAVDGAERLSRIAATRAAFDASVASTIRPLPSRSTDETPLDEP